MQMDDRVALFRDMVSCCHRLYLWSYDCAMHLLDSSCPEQTPMHNLLRMSLGEGDFLSALAQRDTPMLVTNAMDMVWLASPLTQDGELVRVYVLGPLFLDDVSTQRVEAQLVRHGMPGALREEMLRFLRKLPVISWSRVQEYGIMFQYCVTGGRISVSDLRFTATPPTCRTGNPYL